MCLEFIHVSALEVSHRPGQIMLHRLQHATRVGAQGRAGEREGRGRRRGGVGLVERGANGGRWRGERQRQPQRRGGEGRQRRGRKRRRRNALADRLYLLFVNPHLLCLALLRGRFNEWECELRRQREIRSMKFGQRGRKKFGHRK